MLEYYKSMPLVQRVMVLVALNSALSGAAVQLTDLFGAMATHYIVTVATLANTLIAAILVPLTGQSSLVRNVLAMPGIESVKVNANANSTLAQIAVDPDQNKIAPTAAAEVVVTKTALGA